MDIEEAKARYCEQGYFIVVDAVQSDMLDQLDAAAHRVWDKVRSGAVDVGGNGPNTNGTAFLASLPPNSASRCLPNT